jgi:hypothetical protein
MKEEFLHYLWKYKLYIRENLKTYSGESVEILNHGVHNFDSGPDFFNAKIKIDHTIWAGNVEVHINSSDWFVHHHNTDKAYDNVILQVVLNHDKEVYRTNGQKIQTLELKFDKELYSNYKNLIEKETWIPCQDEIQLIDSFKMNSWLEKLSIERLEQKSNNINEILQRLNNSWETSFYYMLARNFGFKLNSDPFEMLAKSLPIKYLAKHKDNLFQIEALLFGQAGFLEDNNGDEYYLNLRKEYQFLKTKFKLKSIEKHLWKFLRTRPGNFPTIRIAQFAQLIYKSKSLFSKIIETKNIEDYYDLLNSKTSEYWNMHYVFNKESVFKSKSLGKSAIDVVLINTVVPFLFVYGKAKGQYEFQEKAINLLENIKAEKNTIISNWDDLNVKAKSAFDTQALIQLKNNYCNEKNCLNCQIGNTLINRK